MEHYSRDRIALRIMNTVSFAVLLFINIRFAFFSGENSLIKIMDINFFMAPYKYLYVLNFVSLLPILIFILIQIDSSSYGIKKKVIEDYGYFLMLTFAAMAFYIYFLFQKIYVLSFVCVLIASILSIIIYLKSQNMKKYMYNDEILVFVYPFSIFTSWNLLGSMITFNFMLKDTLVNGSPLSIIITIIQLLVIVSLSVASMILFADVLFILLQLIYLISVAVNTKLNDYFMPVGYLCFLAIIVIIAFIYKEKNKKK